MTSSFLTWIGETFLHPPLSLVSNVLSTKHASSYNISLGIFTVFLPIGEKILYSYSLDHSSHCQVSWWSWCVKILMVRAINWVVLWSDLVASIEYGSGDRNPPRINLLVHQWARKVQQPHVSMSARPWGPQALLFIMFLFLFLWRKRKRKI